MPTTESDNLKISYDDFGHGNHAILIMTGWCDNRIQFKPLAELLAKHHRVLLMDWRGHGQSEAPRSDFGTPDLVKDARAVIAAAGVKRVTLLAGSHAGWIALELAKQMREAISKIILLDWIVSEAPQSFLGALRGLQSEAYGNVRDALFKMWTEKAPQSVKDFVHAYMAPHGKEMWSLAGREIEKSYLQKGSPLQTMQELNPPVETLHLFTQHDQGYVDLQTAYAKQHPWFHMVNLKGFTSHFPAIEDPQRCAEEILKFV